MKNSPLHFKRLQFPIRVSFAMSINKAQGQSLKIAGIDLEQPCFSHGQLYVACSKVGSGRNLYVLALENKTSNFVYSSVLSFPTLYTHSRGEWSGEASLRVCLAPEYHWLILSEAVSWWSALG
ncbi:hypothetical protein LAZ67_15003275 [Cordylochernes scorpioides]|uniref:Uncharacterized protein n=1 Tax=Cordylochernes scorpioides TaxID=51811 RepID=A0ABY6LCT5_9ARAC|nr:hypothetical protein LAZ67_15003275 [Cordylochernes scorpioides]